MSRAPTSTICVWRGVRLRVRFTADYTGIEGCARIEVIVVSPKRAPLPITESGYLSHFETDGRVRDAAAAPAYIVDWLDREADTCSDLQSSAARPAIIAISSPQYLRL